MSRLITFLTRTRGNPDTAQRFGITDFLAYGYLVLGVLIILIPVMWTFLSSLKPERAIDGFDTRLLPIAQIEEVVGDEGLKPIWELENEDGTVSQVIKMGPTRAMTDVATVEDTATVFQVPRDQLEPAEDIRVATENYLDPILKRNGQDNFTFGTYLFNSVFVTVVATLMTLLINAMAAFALSKYQFRGRLTFTLLIVATLLIPSSIILVSLFFVVWSFGIFGSLWGVIIPAAATPTGGIPAAPVHADYPRRAAGGRPHGCRQRMAHLLAHHHSTVAARPQCSGHPQRHLALERLPLADDRADL